MSTEFRKSKIAKAISGFAGLMMAIMMVGRRCGCSGIRGDG